MHAAGCTILLRVLVVRGKSGCGACGCGCGVVVVRGEFDDILTVSPPIHSKMNDGPRGGASPSTEGGAL